MSRRPPDDDKLRAFLKEAIEDGDYTESFHSEHEHPERNISIDDLLHGLLQNWEHFQKACYDDRRDEWKYYLKTRDIEGDVLHVVIAVSLRKRRFKVITKW